MVELEAIATEEDEAELRGLIERHIAYTGSAAGRRILDRWSYTVTQFVKIMPTDYKQALERMAREAAEAETPALAG
jgi:glutamate synthase (NADPH) large chain